MIIFEVICKNNDFKLFNKTYHITNNKFKNNSKFYVGIRPFNVHICNDGIEAIIKYIEVEGSELIIHLNIEDKEVLVVEKNIGDIRYYNNQNVKVSFDEDYFYFFES